jgi:hypothetical protein
MRRISTAARSGRSSPAWRINPSNPAVLPSRNALGNCLDLPPSAYCLPSHPFFCFFFFYLWNIFFFFWYFFLSSITCALVSVCTSWKKPVKTVEAYNIFCVLSKKKKKTTAAWNNIWLQYDYTESKWKSNQRTLSYLNASLLRPSNLVQRNG